MQTKRCILIFAFVITVLSCDKIKRKGHDAVNKTKHKMAEKKDAAMDKIIPIFNSYEPDTKFNKKRFEEFFGFGPTPDVSEIYCFDDQLGIDSRFQFSFKCDATTKERIIKHLNLIEASQPDNFSSGLWQSFTWWDSAKITTLNPYWHKSERRYRYLWFDKTKQKVYYIEFDL